MPGTEDPTAGHLPTTVVPSETQQGAMFVAIPSRIPTTFHTAAEARLYSR